MRNQKRRDERQRRRRRKQTRRPRRHRGPRARQREGRGSGGDDADSSGAGDDSRPSAGVDTVAAAVVGGRTASPPRLSKTMRATRGRFRAAASTNKGAKEGAMRPRKQAPKRTGPSRSQSASGPWTTREGGGAPGRAGASWRGAAREEGGVLLLSFFFSFLVFDVERHCSFEKKKKKKTATKRKKNPPTGCKGT